MGKFSRVSLVNLWSTWWPIWAIHGKQKIVDKRWTQHPFKMLKKCQKSHVLPMKNVSVCRFQTSPCVPAPRPHVVTHVRVVPVHTGTFWTYTRRRFERTHVDTTPHTHTSQHTTTPHTHHNTPQHHTTTPQQPHNNHTTTTPQPHTPHNTETETERHRDRDRHKQRETEKEDRSSERKRETERERERKRERQREDER